MTDAILTFNAGSSSLKFGVYPVDGGLEPMHAGTVERVEDHGAVMAAVIAQLDEQLGEVRVRAVGHRVVHGGPDFAEPVRVDDAVLRSLDRFSPYAPLHQPHNLAGIRAARDVFDGALQVACFDTAFHRGQPFEEDVFALPRAYFDRGVRRYGFHGLSYDSIQRSLRATAPELHAGRVVVAHLGNGASMCAMRAGQSVGSTMGFTALDGLPMGTRCGQLDPGVVLYLLEQEKLEISEVTDLLYARSGLLGLSGVSNDMRTLEASDDPRARQAIDVFAWRIRRELGGLAAVLGGLDALVFTAGIGENSSRLRARACEGLRWLGLELDSARNEAHETFIQAESSRVAVLVVPTDEESVIAEAVRAVL